MVRPSRATTVTAGAAALTGALSVALGVDYTNAVAFTVTFDSNGSVVSVEDTVTMATLLQYDEE